MNKFADRLKELRIEKKVSQQLLGEKIGYTQAGIAKWEAGTRSPNIDALIALATYFDVSVDYLVGLKDY